jgi:hypothetical protein
VSTTCTFRDYIANLPVAEPPEIFGLHVNAALVRQRGEAKHLLATLAIMQPRTARLPGPTASDAVLLAQVQTCRTDALESLVAVLPAGAVDCFVVRWVI